MRKLSLKTGSYQEGYSACQQYLGDTGMICNPYPFRSLERASWERGWADGLKKLPILTAC